MSFSELDPDAFFREWLGEDPKLVESVSELPFALPARTPALSARARLLGAVTSPALRWAPLFGRLRSLLDLPNPALIEIAQRAVDPSQWVESSLPGVRLLHFSAGPELAGADAGLVWVKPGLQFPFHQHLGQERVLILEGSARDSQGVLWRPGDQQTEREGSSHGFQVLPGPPLVYAVVLFDQIDIDGLRFPPK